MLPLNESGAITIRAGSAVRRAVVLGVALAVAPADRGGHRRLHDRQPELGPDGLLHDLPVGPRVDRQTYSLRRKMSSTGLVFW